MRWSYFLFAYLVAEAGVVVYSGRAHQRAVLQSG